MLVIISSNGKIFGRQKVHSEKLLVLFRYIETANKALVGNKEQHGGFNAQLAKSVHTRVPRPVGLSSPSDWSVSESVE